MYVMYARNVRTVDASMRIGDVEDILNKGRKSERERCDARTPTLTRTARVNTLMSFPLQRSC